MTMDNTHRKSKRGFTLVETVVTLALASLVFLGLGYLVSTLYAILNTSGNLSQAQITANTAMTLIQNSIRNANYVNIESSLPAAVNEKYTYIYPQNGAIKELTNKTQTRELYAAQGQYTYRVSFAKVRDKSLRITITVTGDGKTVYTLESEMVPNNLIAQNITGATQGSCLSYQVTVQTYTPVTSVLVSSNSSFITVQSQTMQFTATPAPSNATVKSVAWSVSNDAIASISQSGLLTPLKNGTVTVTATAMDGSGVKGTKQIIISNQKVTITNMELRSSSGQNQLKVGGNTLKIIPVITPSDATNQAVLWSVKNGDEKYATIDQNGVLTSNLYKSDKSVIVVAQTTDGSNITATIEILIVE